MRTSRIPTYNIRIIMYRTIGARTRIDDLSKLRGCGCGTVCAVADCLVDKFIVNAFQWGRWRRWRLAVSRDYLLRSAAFFIGGGDYFRDIITYSHIISLWCTTGRTL